MSNGALYVQTLPYFEKLTSILAQNGDYLFDTTSADQLIKKYGPPKNIILLANENDLYVLENQTKPFIHFLKENEMEKILDYHPFTGRAPKPGRSHHNVQYPSNYNGSFDFISTLIKSGFPP
jgi:hypothetical protein